MSVLGFVGDLVFDPLVPGPLVGLLALVLGAGTVWVYGRAASRLPAGRRWTLLALRLGAVALALLILLQPSRVERLPVEQRDKVILVGLDASRSMKQTDAGRMSRFDAAREVLWNSGAVPRGDASVPATAVRLFRFGEDAQPLTGPLTALTPEERTTRFHQSVQTMLGSLGGGEGAHALFLLTDGHDFELANPSQTALLARNRQVPVYPVSFGGEGNVRDVSVRITSYQPFHYARQTIRLASAIRVLGYAYETLHVSLLREGKVVQTRAVVVQDEAQVPVRFDVAEPAAGQFEYEIRVQPLGGEADTANNSASVYCNVIDKKIRVLLLEGQPYWDTTFLLRSLRRNEKLDVDSAVAYAKDRTSVLRTEERKEPFRLPETAAEWNEYDVVLLGKGVDAMLSETQIGALERWVEQTGGALVFVRADAFSGKGGAALQPVAWGPLVSRSGPVKAGREGQSIAPLRVLADGDGALPSPLGAHEAGERQPLTATLAVSETGEGFPAMVHRRFGAGQVLAVGVDGLWRWAFNARSAGELTVFDRFWDQMVLWLMSGRDFMPNSRFTFRSDTGNVPLGEKVHLRVVPRDPGTAPKSVPVAMKHEGKEVARLTLVPVPGGTRLTAEFLPERPGRYEAVADLPDGTRQSVRFAAYADDAEETEVAADPGYLRRLAEASRGRLLKPEEFAGMLTAVKSTPQDETARTRTVPVWDEAWFFWVIGGLFGADWYLRRRWGLC